MGDGYVETARKEELLARGFGEDEAVLLDIPSFSSDEDEAAAPAEVVPTHQHE